MDERLRQAMDAAHSNAMPGTSWMHLGSKVSGFPVSGHNYLTAGNGGGGGGGLNTQAGGGVGRLRVWPGGGGTTGVSTSGAATYVNDARDASVLGSGITGGKIRPASARNGAAANGTGAGNTGNGRISSSGLGGITGGRIRPLSARTANIGRHGVATTTTTHHQPRRHYSAMERRASAGSLASVAQTSGTRRVTTKLRQPSTGTYTSSSTMPTDRAASAAHHAPQQSLPSRASSATSSSTTAAAAPPATNGDAREKFIRIAGDDSFRALDKAFRGEPICVDVVRMKGAPLRRAILKLRSYPVATLRLTETGFADPLDLLLLSSLTEVRSVHMSKGNPIVCDPLFRSMMCVCLPNMSQLNGNPVTTRERRRAEDALEPLLSLYGNCCAVAPLHAIVLDKMNEHERKLSGSTTRATPSSSSSSSLSAPRDIGAADAVQRTAESSDRAAALCRQLDAMHVIELKAARVAAIAARSRESEDVGAETTPQDPIFRDLVDVSHFDDVDESIRSTTADILSTGLRLADASKTFEKLWPEAVEILVQEALEESDALRLRCVHL